MSSHTSTLTNIESPPGFPDDDDDSPDGGGPPKRSEAFTDPILLAYRERIAALRECHSHITASFMRDELLSQVEAWLDPHGLVYRATLQTIQGRAAVELALAIDPKVGF